MKHIKKFNESSSNWSGTIMASTRDIIKYWNHSSKMPERYFNYIKKELHPFNCELNINTIDINNPDDILRDKVKMKMGNNTYSNICIDNITIWLSSGFNDDNLELTDDGYFNTTIYCEHVGGLSNMTSEYRFTSDTIEDLCEFLKRILEDGVIEYNNRISIFGLH